MTIHEFRAAVELVDTGDDRVNFDNIHIFDGFAMDDFGKVTCTIIDVAGLLVWQARTFAGTWDCEAMDVVRQFGRKRFIIV